MKAMISNFRRAMGLHYHKTKGAFGLRKKRPVVHHYDPRYKKGVIGKMALCDCTIAPGCSTRTGQAVNNEKRYYHDLANEIGCTPKRLRKMLKIHRRFVKQGSAATQAAA